MHMITARHDRCRLILSPWCLVARPLDYRKRTTKCVISVTGRSRRPSRRGTFRSRGHFAVQLLQRGAHPIQYALTPWCQPIDAGRFRLLRLRCANPPGPLQPSENRIERAGTDAVSVTAQLVEHPLAVHALRLGGVIEDVDFPKA